jgi:lysophospholipase L1-like esterase
VKPSRLALFAAIMIAQFVLFEAGLRWAGGSEAAPVFQQLFMQDSEMGGYRLKPGATAHFKTTEFETDIAINSSGVRDSEIPAKPVSERRIVVLGDSLVLSVQVDAQETFCALLQKRLNAASKPGEPAWRVINAGVQGYGPVEELEFYQHVARRFQPDIVLVALFVGNDAMEAGDTAGKLASEGNESAGAPAAAPASPGPQLDAVKRPSRWPLWLRRLTRRTMVTQIVRMRAVTLLERFGDARPIDRALTMYLPAMPPDMARGLDVTREAVRRLAALAAEDGARTGIILVPARFQVADDDFGYLAEAVEQTGSTLVRDAGTDRFRQAMAPLALPIMDALPVLRNDPRNQQLFFKSTAHFTVTGHEAMAAGLESFLRGSGLLLPAASGAGTPQGSKLKGPRP